MTKSEIKAELRRSACDDESPWISCKSFAWIKAREMTNGESLLALAFSEKQNNVRTFFLLVAEAL